MSSSEQQAAPSAATRRLSQEAAAEAAVAEEQGGEEGRPAKAARLHGGSTWAGAGEYMAFRHDKQTEQQVAMRADLEARGERGSRLFAGVTAWLNGGGGELTGEQLRRLLVLHGGAFEATETAACTHILAVALSAGTARKLLARRAPARVVHPRWVTESLAAGRLLPEADFALAGLAQPGQQRLEAKAVKEFLGASRLAFLGGWARAQRAQLAALQASAGGPEPAPGAERTLLHADLDCFFAAVAVRCDPGLAGAPLAVCSGEATGAAEIACPSYEARACGVRAGMSFARAQQLCAAAGLQLRAAPYQLEECGRLALLFHGALCAFSRRCEAASIDEAFLDVTGLGCPSELAAAVRAAVLARTGLACSVGIGPNKLLAKTATGQAKPPGPGVFLLPDVAAGRALLAPLTVDRLHGVGRQTADALRSMGLETVGQLAAAPLAALRARFGPARGPALQAAAQGEGESRVEAEAARPASVSVESSYGVRCAAFTDAAALLGQLAELLVEKLGKGAAVGKLTLKAKQSVDVSVPPGKPNGCGACHDFSRSRAFRSAVSAAPQLAAAATEMLLALMQEKRVGAEELRGLGLAASELAEPRGAASPPAAAAAAARRQARTPPPPAPAPRRRLLASETEYGGLSMSQLDPEALRAMPAELRAELEAGLARAPLPAPRRGKAKGRQPLTPLRPPPGEQSPAPPPPPPRAAPRLCAPEPLPAVRAALRCCVERLCARGGECDAQLAAAAELLLAYCVDRVRARDCEGAQLLATSARRLAARLARWAPHCEAACARLADAMARREGGARACTLPGWTQVV